MMLSWPILMHHGW